MKKGIFLFKMFMTVAGNLISIYYGYPPTTQYCILSRLIRFKNQVSFKEGIKKTF